MTDLPQRPEPGLLTRTRRSTLASLVQKIVTPALSLLVTVVLARGLSAVDYGVYGVMQGLLPYFTLLTGLGLGYAFLRFIPEFHTHGQDGWVRRLVTVGLSLRGLASVAALVVAVLLFGPISGFLGLESTREQFAVFGIAMILTGEAILVSQALNGLFLHAWAVGAQIVYSLLKAVAVAVLVLRFRFTLTEALWVEVATAAVILVLCYAAYRARFASRVPAARGLREQSRRIARFSAFSILNDVGAVVFDRSTDYLVIGHYLTAVALGPYFFASQLAGYFGKLNVVLLFRPVVSPAFFEKYSRNPEQSGALFQLLVKLCLFFSMPVLCAYPFIGREFVVALGGSEFASSYAILGIFIAMTPIEGLAYPCGLML